VVKDWVKGGVNDPVVEMSDAGPLGGMTRLLSAPARSVRRAAGVALFAALAIAAAAAPASAGTMTANPLGYSECVVSVSRFYYGDNGYIWIDFNEGGAAVVAADDDNKQAYLSMLLTAKTTNRQLKVRYNHPGGSCTVTNTDLIGIWFI